MGVVCCRSVRSKHFLIHESGIVKLSGLRSMVSVVDGGARSKVCVARRRIWCVSPCSRLYMVTSLVLVTIYAS